MGIINTGKETTAIKEAQEKLDWAISNDNRKFKCQVTSYNGLNYGVNFGQEESEVCAISMLRDPPLSASSLRRVRPFRESPIYLYFKA